VLWVRAGRTLQQMLDDVAQGVAIAATLRVEIGGVEVPRALWAKVRPKALVPIHCTVMPAGGGSGNKILRTLALVALTVFTAGVASGALLAGVSLEFGGLVLAGATLASAISVVGMLVINALIPPPKPPSIGGGGESPGRWNMLTGSSNQAAPYGPVPVVLGECKVFPTHAAMPYSETLGDTSYQRLMFDLGHDYGGPDDPTVYMQVTDLKIGESDIASFDDVQYEITKSPTLYTSDVAEVAVSAAMNDADSVVRTTSPNVSEVSLDVVFPQGLFGLDDKGKQVSVTAYLTIEVSPAGAGTWTAVPVADARITGLVPVGSTLAGAQVRSGSRKPFAVGVAFPVATGQYDVRVSRGTTSWGSSNSSSRIGDATWTVLRSIKPTNPSNTGTVKLCMRIKASEQLNGTLQTLSCIVHQKIPVYDAGTETWSAPTLNYNPAWVYAWLLRSCPALSVHVPDTRIDLASLSAFADFCTANEFEVRGVADARTTVRALLDEVLSCALGALSMRDGRYGVVFDDGSTLPTMVFTPLDSRGFSVSRMFSRLPHALKVRFRNPAAYWEIDEVLVLDDGYSYRGVDARGAASTDPEPTEFETLELRMACDAFTAWRAGRFHLAQAKFRPNRYRWETDIANIGCCRGDVVHVAHDVTEWGTGWSRVVSLSAGALNGDAATLVLDERIVTDPALSYSVRLCRDDLTSEVVAAVPHSPETETFYLASLPTGINPGDVAVLGQTDSETVKLLVTGVQPAADLAAAMTAVQYDARVAPYWADPPEIIVSEVSGTAYRDPPNAPVITVVVSDEVNDTRDDAGVADPQVHVRIDKPSGYGIAVLF
jgi:hypothetical protein